MGRFMRRGITKVYFLPTVAATGPTGSPTRAEITGGTNLTPDIAEIAGFTYESTDIPTPDMESDFDTTVPGTAAAPQSSITFYEDDTTATLETLLPRNTNGYIYIMRKGDTAALPADLFPVRVSSRAPEYSAGNEPARFKINFAISDKPRLDVPIPT